MDTSLALELATLLPELREQCPDDGEDVQEGANGVHTQFGYRSFQDMPHPACQGRGWLVPDLHVETIRAAMLARGWEHSGHSHLNGRFSHLFLKGKSPHELFGEAPSGADDLETCVRAAVAALKQEAKHE